MSNSNNTINKVNNQIVKMVNSFIHKKLTSLMIKKNTFLFPLSKQVYKAIEINKSCEQYNQTILELYSTKSSNPMLNENMLYNLRTLRVNKNDSVEVVLNKKYFELLSEYASSTKCVKDIAQLSNNYSPKFILLLAETLLKSCK